VFVEAHRALSCDFKILCRGFSSVLDVLEFLQTDPLIQGAQTRALDGRDVNEYVPAATYRLNKSVTLSRVEPLQGAFSQMLSPNVAPERYQAGAVRQTGLAAVDNLSAVTGHQNRCWGLGAISMKTAAEYRAMAEECFKWARETHDNAVRKGYLKLAQVWLDAASQRDGLPAIRIAPDDPSKTPHSSAD